MKIVCTLQELYDIVNNNMRVYNAIIIENVKVNFDIDFRTILKGCNICDFKDKDTFCVLKTPVRLFNITAPKLSFVSIEFNNEIYILVAMTTVIYLTSISALVNSLQKSAIQ